MSWQDEWKARRRLLPTLGFGSDEWDVMCAKMQHIFIAGVLADAGIAPPEAAEIAHKVCAGAPSCVDMSGEPDLQYGDPS